MACDCHTESEAITQRSTLKIILAINAVMFLAELTVGLIADSTGLIADSLDMLADALVYGLALMAVGESKSRKIKAARASGIFQIALACGVLLDIFRRVIYGSDPQSLLMWVFGLIALAANLTCLRLIAKHRKGEVHMRASWIFSRNDVIANVGVILAGLLVAQTGSPWPDLVMGLLISIVVMRGGLEILSDAKNERSCE